MKTYTKAQKRALAKYFGFDYELSDEEARVPLIVIFGIVYERSVILMRNYGSDIE
jgi:hypothetical protein